MNNLNIFHRFFVSYYLFLFPCLSLPFAWPFRLPFLFLVLPISLPCLFTCLPISLTCPFPLLMPFSSYFFLVSSLNFYFFLKFIFLFALLISVHFARVNLASTIYITGQKQSFCAYCWSAKLDGKEKNNK